ncbi:MAG: glycosyl transferase family 1 [Ahrensia sp.]|nr:glycosyl transferase family 1 [Ahrensia sp.]
MKIVMFTNTYTPHVGGVARAVSGLVAGLRARGHRVLVAAPTFAGMPKYEEDVVRIPAVQRFAGSDFSMPLPVTLPLTIELDDFEPDIVHSHHPFLLGDTALRVAAGRKIPAIFTYHTRYELYGHYLGPESEVMKRLVLNLSLGYCDLCDHVIAPSESIRQHLGRNGVTAPVSVIPSGIDCAAFGGGNAARALDLLGVPTGAPIVGHVGRLAPEKNLSFLTDALIRFLKGNPQACCIVTGDGPMRAQMEQAFMEEGLAPRLRFTGVLTGQDLADVYKAMDIFAFSSLSETQGLVLAEAMASGTPVVALDAPGAREVVRDRVNGRLLDADASAEEFAGALTEIAGMPRDDAQFMRDDALETAEAFSAETALDRIIALYEEICALSPPPFKPSTDLWETAKRRIAREAELFGNVAQAVSDAVLVEGPENGNLRRNDGDARP